MSLILNIDTSSEIAFLSLTMDGNIIGSDENTIQKNHAAYVHPAIKNLMEQAGKNFQELDAIAVTGGPGSYTGIRVGMATAKGLCFALNKPFILINSLEVLARDIIDNHRGSNDILYCPMIDARRMEVYTALYDKSGNALLPPTALVIDENSFGKFTIHNTLVVAGSGAAKCKNQVAFKDAVFVENVNLNKAMATLCYEKYTTKSFSDVVYSEPYYLKDFFNTS